MERQKDYIIEPTVEKLNEINDHDRYILQEETRLNIHLQRIIRPFRIQVGYEGCMTKFIANNLLKVNTLRKHETKPEHNGEIEIEHNDEIESERKIETTPERKDELKPEIKPKRKDGIRIEHNERNEIKPNEQNGMKQNEIEHNKRNGIELNIDTEFERKSNHEIKHNGPSTTIGTK